MNNKKIFFFVIVFMAFQALFTYKGVETIPFFNYGMYSDPLITGQVHEKYIIKLDGKKLDVENSENNIFPYFLYENLRIYKKLKDPNYNDIVLKAIQKRFKNKVSPSNLDEIIRKVWNNDENIDKFPDWLFRLIKKRSGKTFHQLEVEVEYYTYKNNNFKLIRTEPIINNEY